MVLKSPSSPPPAPPPLYSIFGNTIVWYTNSAEFESLLELHCETPAQKSAFALPGLSVKAVHRAVVEAQVRSSRPSYTNAFLIQSRGQINNPVSKNNRPSIYAPF
jgi:hypothetical protein